MVTITVRTGHGQRGSDVSISRQQTSTKGKNGKSVTSDCECPRKLLKQIPTFSRGVVINRYRTIVLELQMIHDIYKLFVILHLHGCRMKKAPRTVA